MYPIKKVPIINKKATRRSLRAPDSFSGGTKTHPEPFLRLAYAQQLS